MTLDFFTLETSTGSGDGGTEGAEEEGSESTESQEGQQTESDLVPRSELSKANAEAAKRRREANELRKRVEELEGHSKTELERERDRAKKAEEKYQDAEAKLLVARGAVLAIDAGVAAAAAKDAATLLDWDSIEDPNDDDSVVAAFKELVKEKPYLAGRRGSADGAAGTHGESRGPDSMNDRIRRAAGR